MSREIVFDTETTGLKPFKGDRITEIGCVEVIDLLPTGKTFRRYVNPEREVPEEVVKITGLTTEFLADKPLFAEIVEDFLEFVGDSKMVAHNARFDRDFLNVELTKLDRQPFEDKRFIDTLVIARKKFPGAYNSLDALCKRFSVSLSERALHGALLDAKLLAEVYLELNGGRERRLDLDQRPRSNAKNGQIPILRSEIKAHTAPLTKEQREEHLKFLNEIGGKPLWNKYL
ncbi:MAG: DNA polymerase III subunit epsilon [Robiginitomaculum sp.]|nr:DNA polymerase III subunit epsilon [Robiginitomaculum sp.]MDQ7078900.1 DNA polymerase III subunit epsilon [Robiginitomaculum sp.]